MPQDRPLPDREKILATLNDIDPEPEPSSKVYAIRVMLKLLAPELYDAVLAVVNNETVWRNTNRTWIWKDQAFKRY